MLGQRMNRADHHTITSLMLCLTNSEDVCMYICMKRYYSNHVLVTSIYFLQGSSSKYIHIGKQLEYEGPCLFVYQLPKSIIFNNSLALNSYIIILSVAKVPTVQHVNLAWFVDFCPIAGTFCVGPLDRRIFNS